MVSTSEQAQKFLDPKTVALISNYRLLARLIVDGYFIGQHRGPRHAFSLEYSKHREYYPGDSLKLVDWKLYGKSDKFFVKQFEEETNLESWMLMDISKSMDYQGTPGTISKLRYATYLASALSYLLLSQKDLVGLMLFERKIQKIIPPSAALRQLNIILREMKMIKAGGISKFEESARLVASRVKKRGLLVLFSDLLAQPEDVEKTLKQFLHKGNELIVFHILSQEELQFPFRKFGYFEDLETKKRILLHPDAFKKEYRLKMENYLKAVKKTCLKLRISYQMLQTNTPFDVAIRTFLQSRARMN